MQAAEAAYRRAADLQPRDIPALTGLARSVEALERVAPALNKTPYPHSAGPIFAELLELMPVNLYAHGLHIQYLQRRQAPQAELDAAIARMIFLHPPGYFQLLRQPLYRPELDEMLGEQLEAALAAGIFPAEAMRALADLAQRRGEPAVAADWYRRSIPSQTYRDTSALYLHLGGLQLAAAELEAAESSFLQALHHGEREAKIRRIEASYGRAGLHREFLAFADRLETAYPVGEYLDLLRAQALLALDQPALATARLLRISAPDHLGESHYLLAKIAEKAGDWDEMELKAQRATVHAPNNASYHLLFSQALQRQKKWPQAEQAATAAITHSEKRNPWLHNHRAWLRWHQHNSSGAEADWREAVQLSPKTADFHYQLAQVYAQGGNRQAALRHLDRAIALKPEQASYRDQRARLQADN
jgi:tetratricopeptide (TPR) repeat protein